MISIKAASVCSVLALASGCGHTTLHYDKSAGLAASRQVSRLSVLDYGDGKEGTPIRRCLEFTGPAAALESLKIDTSAKVKATDEVDVEGTAKVERSESFAQVYTVGAILQFAHAMSYRLCEARLNNDLDSAEYIKQFSNLMKSTQELLGKQIDLEKARTAGKQADAAKSKEEALRSQAEATKAIVTEQVKLRAVGKSDSTPFFERALESLDR